MRIEHIRSAALATAACSALAPAAALVQAPAGYFVQGGVWEHGAFNASAGAFWPWRWRWSLPGAELGGLTEASVSHWTADSDEGRRGFTQLALVPLLRLRFGQGRSPWFAEAGIGVSVMDRRFASGDKRFSTTFNFVDVVGVGRSFGPARGQEIGLRLQHVSNASIRSPNPGQNFVQLRYAASF